MSAYIVATYDITDQEGYGPYVPSVIPLPQKHNAEILVADYAPHTYEGDQRGVVVVVRFESEEAARAWYEDPAYDAVKKIRLDASANGGLHLVKQFVPPQA
jgi:uncharacterized protein (DUF1330 family)